MTELETKLAEALRLVLAPLDNTFLTRCATAREALAQYEQAKPAEPVAGLPKADIIRAAVAAMPHTSTGVADDLIAGHTLHTEADDVVAIFCAGLRFAAKEEAKPLKARPDFIAGYDAGLIDGRACERRDHARGEIRADFEARMKADGLSVARLDCGLYFSPKVGNEWEAEKRKFAAPVAQAEPMEMALCEASRVVLREGQLYRFRRVGDCETCAELSKQSLEAYGQPPKENQP